MLGAINQIFKSSAFVPWTVFSYFVGYRDKL